MLFSVEVAEQQDGRHFAHVSQVPGAQAYGATADEAVARAQANALRLLADQIERGAHVPNLLSLNFRATIDADHSCESRPSRRRLILGITISFTALGVLTIGAAQWWISALLAKETGLSFVDNFRAHPLPFLATWSGVLGLFLVAGVLIGSLSAYLRDRLHRSKA
jgi:predicted RNase H-like HicB family nuclease